MGCSVAVSEPVCNCLVAGSGREVTVEVPDSIERELILPAPRERVWTALTRPDQLSAWFGTQATIDLRPGGEVSIAWDGSTGPRGAARGVIEAVEPPNRWHSAGNPVRTPNRRHESSSRLSLILTARVCVC